MRARRKRWQAAARFTNAQASWKQEPLQGAGARSTLRTAKQAGDPCNKDGRRAALAPRRERFQQKEVAVSLYKQ